MNNIENTNEILAIVILGVAFTAVLVFAQILHHFFKVGANHTRKIIHFSVGSICIIFPFQFTNHWIVLSSTVVFIALLLYSRKKKLLTSLDQHGQASIGDILLPVAIYLNFMLFMQYDFDLTFYLPLLVLTISDPAAYYGGFLFKKTEKSIHGAIFFVISAFLSCWIFLSIYSSVPDSDKLLLSVFCGICGSIVEYFSKKGWDNLTIPLTISFILVIYFEFLVNHGIN